MADLASVEQSLVSAITQIIYPAGTANPSLTGAPVIIYRGWPIPRNLDKDLASGTVNISVFAQDNERKVTRFPREWQVLSQPTVNLTLTVSDNTVTIGGTTSSPLNAAVSVNGRTYVYAVQSNDSPTTIATALATLSGGTSSGPVVTIPGASHLSAVAGGVGTMIRETKRQVRGFIVTLWCPDPDSRDAIAGPLDEALADIDYLTLPDGSAARLIYEKTRVSDRSERDNLYRRDLFYSVEYATTDTQNAYQIVEIILNLDDFQGNPLRAIDVAIIPIVVTNWDGGQWDDGASMWADAGNYWDSGRWDDGRSWPPGVVAWDGGNWDDGATAWLGATWDAGNWDTRQYWDS